MVLDFYKLKEQPFGVTPDPRYLYLSPTHREALSSLRYGISVGRGFMALIAKPGMGKTTLLFQLLELLSDSARTVFLFQTLCTPAEFLRSLLADLGIEDHGGDFVQMHAKLNELVARQSVLQKPIVIVVDEAQNLDDSTLEVVRMLSNFETPREKLIQIVLAGQPQFAEKLNAHNMVQLRQRVSILCRLKPFTAGETDLFIDHRLRVAGYDFSASLFSDRARAMIADYSAGIPRNINNICFNALSLGCAEQQKTIDHNVISEVVKDLDLQPILEEQADVRRLHKNPEQRTNERSKDARRIRESISRWLQQPWKLSQARLRDPLRHMPRPRPLGERLRITGDSFISSLGPLSSRFAVVGVLLAGLSWSLIHADKRPNRPHPAVPVPTVAAPQDASTPAAGSTTVAETSHFATTEAPTKETASGLEHATDASMPVPRTAPPVGMPDSSQAIVVTPNQTLYRISLRSLGRFDSGTLEQILELNPGLRDPDLIQPGQRIRIPSQSRVTQNDRSAENQHKNAPAKEMEKP